MTANCDPKRWPADSVERRRIDSLIPYARNSRTHSDEQVAQIAASMREWGWTNPVLVDEAGGIIAGHGRILAARKLGLDEAPVMVAKGWSEAQKRAYVIADNKLALNAGWDNEALKFELEALDEAGFNLEKTGFSLAEIEEIAVGLNPDEPGGLSENYSRKIEAPIYEITGACPSVDQMMDRAKTAELQAEIDAADLPDDVRQFLHFAAERHTVFNFRNIAEFYAHADADVQNLMERSALVIIDFNKAIEEGFVRLTNQVAALYAEDHAE